MVIENLVDKDDELMYDYYQLINLKKNNKFEFKIFGHELFFQGQMSSV
jgi:hypothetical protein